MTVAVSRRYANECSKQAFCFWPPPDPLFPASAARRYGAVIRGDQSSIYIGGYTSIGDRTVIQSAAINPTGFSARTYIGDYVTIGQGCILRACTVDDNSIVGDGCIIQEVKARAQLLLSPRPLASAADCRRFFHARVYAPRRPPSSAASPPLASSLPLSSALSSQPLHRPLCRLFFLLCLCLQGALVDRNAMLEAGSLLPSGARVPSGEVYGGSPASFVRKLAKAELEEFQMTAEQTQTLAAKHADEFLPYGTQWQLKEEMEGVKAK